MTLRLASTKTTRFSSNATKHRRMCALNLLRSARSLMSRRLTTAEPSCASTCTVDDRLQLFQHYQRCRQTQNCHCKKYFRVSRHLRQKLDHCKSDPQSWQHG